MNDEGEWGPWIEHDGKGCPVPVGTRVHLVGEYMLSGRYERVLTIGGGPGYSWDWSYWPEFTRVLRYRIRRPRALLDLIDMVENLPAPADDRVDA